MCPHSHLYEVAPCGLWSESFTGTRGGEKGTHLVLASPPAHGVTLAEPFLLLCLFLSVPDEGVETLTSLPVSPFRWQLWCPSFTEGKTGLERLSGPQLFSKKGARLDLNLGLSDSGLWALNGRVAKAPLGGNMQLLVCTTWKRHPPVVTPLEDQGSPSTQ